MTLRFFLLIFFCFLSRLATADTDSEEAYWDYGIGFGAVHYEHYPASNQFADFALPAPTFQYRGKILRADDRDGGRLYLLKGSTITLEMSGAGFPALDSGNNDARKNMDNIPWLIALGPQIVWQPSSSWEVSLGAYQATSTDFVMTRWAGQIFEARGAYLWEAPMQPWGFFKEEGRITGKLSLSLKGASKELQQLYYEVRDDQVLSWRPAYEAKSGVLSRDLTYYQSMKVGKVSLNFGISLASYDWSANRESPLHKSDHNITGLIGMNYVLGGSAKPAVPEEETSGLINRIRERRQNPTPIE